MGFEGGESSRSSTDRDVIESGEVRSDATARIALEVERRRESFHSQPELEQGEDEDLPDEIQRARMLVGASLRLVGSAVFAVWILVQMPTLVILWSTLLGFTLWSVLGVLLVLFERMTPARRWILLLSDVSLVSLVIYGLGAQTTPATLLYLFLTVAWAAQPKRIPGAVVLGLSIAWYGAILFGEELGWIPRAPLVTETLAPHTVLGGSSSAFFITAIGLILTYFFIAFFVARIEKQALTERKLRVSEREAHEREAELWQRLEEVQRLEALGRLAGGISHDFNNLLTGIIGYVRFARQRLEPGDEAADDLDEALHGAERASELTAQLLAFSRKQMYRPRVIDLNELVSKVGRMLSRILGEDVALDIIEASEPALIKADPGQMERIVVNLSVNARDAMPGGGTLGIMLANVDLDATYCESLVGLEAGAYVMVAVSDTGMGIDPDITSKIFEPFFTTKEQGKGTGLGLSTVYGIVTQNGGNVLVTSAPGEGTTFTIYLPAVEGSPESLQSSAPESAKGDETGLVVEDEVMVRRITARLLKQSGYQVIVASSGKEAIELAKGHEGGIQLLLSDVIMPQMSGAELAETLRGFLPDIRVIFMSGYAENVLVQEGLIDGDTQLVEKPFSHEDLLATIRETLDS